MGLKYKFKLFKVSVNESDATVNVVKISFTWGPAEHNKIAFFLWSLFTPVASMNYSKLWVHFFQCFEIHPNSGFASNGCGAGKLTDDMLFTSVKYLSSIYLVIIGPHRLLYILVTRWTKTL